jgi:colanic acid/amylovoran biosynthesis glycosyltransferase
LQSRHNYLIDAACNSGMFSQTLNPSFALTRSDTGSNSGTSVAYLVSRYPAVSHTFILREVQGLRLQGIRVEVASVNEPDREVSQMTSDEREEAATTYGIKRHGVRGAMAAVIWGLGCRPVGVLRTLSDALGTARGLRRIFALAYAVEALMVARWMAKRGLSHLHVHFGNEAATVGMLVKTFSKAALSLTIHGPDEFDDVPGQLLKRKIERADLVVCISQFARSQLMRLSHPRHWPKLEVCRLGVDPQRFTPAARAQVSGHVRLLSVGRLTPAKGQWLLLQACNALKHTGTDFQLTIVGDGPDRARLQAYAAETGLSERVRFTGSLNQGEVRAELDRADAFVLPSLAEGIPVVLMEAMASGVPCISTPVNGIPELIQHDINGLLATPGDATSLAHQLHRLIAEPALRQRLALAGRSTVQTHFHLQQNVAALAGILARVPEPHRKGA